MVQFIEANGGRYAVEPICAVLPIAPSTYYEQAVRRRDPAKLPVRARRDEVLKLEIQRVWDENEQVYGVRKIWEQLSASR